MRQKNANLDLPISRDNLILIRIVNGACNGWAIVVCTFMRFTKWCVVRSPKIKIQFICVYLYYLFDCLFKVPIAIHLFRYATTTHTHTQIPTSNDILLHFYLHSLKRRFFLKTNSNELMGGMRVCIYLETSCNLLFKLNAPVSSIHRSITMATCAVLCLPYHFWGLVFSTKQLAYCLSLTIKSLFESSVHSF